MTATFRVNVAAQARALLDLDQAPVSLGLYPLVRGGYDRIIFTGTRAVHLAACASWQRMQVGKKVSRWIDTASLLGEVDAITSDSLIIATSRSGRCAEVLALLERFDQTTWPATLVAVTEDLASPLAEAADCEVLLRSESSSSPTGFLNALAAHDYLASMMLGEDNDDVATTAHVVAATTFPTVVREVAAHHAAHPRGRLAYFGFDEHAATALYAALLTRETTPVDGHGYIVRRGLPISLVPNVFPSTAVLFTGSGGADDKCVGRLASELVAAGTAVLIIGSTNVPGVQRISGPDRHVSAQVAHGVLIAEHFVSCLAAEAQADGLMH
ncbi:SIS domain-containing protein [Mycobacterium sp. HNNTM2301]|uniref:SIS domain-containing protein n=1 Tax=Mycobacterium hainanense TaxID=3289775 RepID=UPI0035A68B2B